jgi:hypothetical protein
MYTYAEVKEERPSFLESNQCTEDTKRKLSALLEEYEHLFINEFGELGGPSPFLKPFQIDTGDHPPHTERPRRHSKEEREKLKARFAELERGQIIRPGNGKWSSGVVMVKKDKHAAAKLKALKGTLGDDCDSKLLEDKIAELEKREKDVRVCSDYRGLNRLTVFDSYPMPRIRECLNRMAKYCLFCVTDLFAGYYQVPNSDEAREKTQVVTEFGVWEFLGMNFGRSNGRWTEYSEA